MKRTRYKKGNQSTFELLSDLSLSTLGLFLIVFVIYALIFNSQGSQLIEIFADNQKLLAEKEKLAADSEKLRARVDEVETELEQAEALILSTEAELSATQEALDTAKQAVKQASARNLYVGFYRGTGQGNRHGGNCAYVERRIPEEYEVFFLNDLIIVNQITSGTVLSYRATGSFTDNYFRGDSLITSRADGSTYHSCATDSVNLEFRDDGVQLYIPGELNDEGVFLSRSGGN